MAFSAARLETLSGMMFNFVNAVKYDAAKGIYWWHWDGKGMDPVSQLNQQIGQTGSYVWHVSGVQTNANAGNDWFDADKVKSDSFFYYSTTGNFGALSVASHEKLLRNLARTLNESFRLLEPLLDLKPVDGWVTLGAMNTPAFYALYEELSKAGVERPVPFDSKSTSASASANTSTGLVVEDVYGEPQVRVAAHIFSGWVKQIESALAKTLSASLDVLRSNGDTYIWTKWYGGDLNTLLGRLKRFGIDAESSNMVTQETVDAWRLALNEKIGLQQTLQQTPQQTPIDTHQSLTPEEIKALELSIGEMDALASALDALRPDGTDPNEMAALGKTLSESQELLTKLDANGVLTAITTAATATKTDGIQYGTALETSDNLFASQQTIDLWVAQLRSMIAISEAIKTNADEIDVDSLSESMMLPGQPVLAAGRHRALYFSGTYAAISWIIVGIESFATKNTAVKTALREMFNAKLKASLAVENGNAKGTAVDTKALNASILDASKQVRDALFSTHESRQTPEYKAISDALTKLSGDVANNKIRSDSWKAAFSTDVFAGAFADQAAKNLNLKASPMTGAYFKLFRGGQGIRLTGALMAIAAPTEKLFGPNDESDWFNAIRYITSLLQVPTDVIVNLAFNTYENYRIKKYAIDTAVAESKKSKNMTAAEEIQFRKYLSEEFDRKPSQFDAGLKKYKLAQYFSVKNFWGNSYLWDISQLPKPDPTLPKPVKLDLSLDSNKEIKAAVDKYAQGFEPFKGFDFKRELAGGAIFVINDLMQMANDMRLLVKGGLTQEQTWGLTLDFVANAGFVCDDIIFTLSNSPKYLKLAGRVGATSLVLFTLATLPDFAAAVRSVVETKDAGESVNQAQIGAVVDATLGTALPLLAIPLIGINPALGLLLMLVPNFESLLGANDYDTVVDQLRAAGLDNEARMARAIQRVTYLNGIPLVSLGSTAYAPSIFSPVIMGKNDGDYSSVVESLDKTKAMLKDAIDKNYSTVPWTMAQENDTLVAMTSGYREVLVPLDPALVPADSNSSNNYKKKYQYWIDAIDTYKNDLKEYYDGSANWFQEAFVQRVRNDLVRYHSPLSDADAAYKVADNNGNRAVAMKSAAEKVMRDLIVMVQDGVFSPGYYAQDTINNIHVFRDNAHPDTGWIAIDQDLWNRFGIWKPNGLSFPQMIQLALYRYIDKAQGTIAQANSDKAYYVQQKQAINQAIEAHAVDFKSTLERMISLFNSDPALQDVWVTGVRKEKFDNVPSTIYARNGDAPSITGIYAAHIGRPSDSLTLPDKPLASAPQSTWDAYKKELDTFHASRNVPDMAAYLEEHAKYQLITDFTTSLDAISGAQAFTLSFAGSGKRFYRVLSHGTEADSSRLVLDVSASTSSNNYSIERGNLTLLGGSDQDIYRLSTSAGVYVKGGSGSNAVFFDLASAGQQIDFSKFTDIKIVSGSSYNDTVTGSGGDDMYDSGGGDDTVSTGGGNDIVYSGGGNIGLGNDDDLAMISIVNGGVTAVDGGSGSDMLQLAELDAGGVIVTRSASSSDYNFSSAWAASTDTKPDGATVSLPGGSQNGSFKNVEKLILSNGNDTATLKGGIRYINLLNSDDEKGDVLNIQSSSVYADMGRGKKTITVNGDNVKLIDVHIASGFGLHLITIGANVAEATITMNAETGMIDAWQNTGTLNIDIKHGSDVIRIGSGVSHIKIGADAEGVTILDMEESGASYIHLDVQETAGKTISICSQIAAGRIEATVFYGDKPMAVFTTPEDAPAHAGSLQNYLENAYVDYRDMNGNTVVARLVEADQISSSMQIDRQTDNLVEAMAAFAPPAGQTNSNNNLNNNNLNNNNYFGVWH